MQRTVTSSLARAFSSLTQQASTSSSSGVFGASKSSVRNSLISKAYSGYSNSANVPLPSNFSPNSSDAQNAKYSLFKAYFLLSKARLSLLVASTASAGYVLGSGSELDWAQMGWTTLGTFLAAASANSLNQVWERHNDSQMKRTMKRPLPSGRLSVLHALGFAAVSGLSGVSLLHATSNETAAALGAANIALYSLVYTPLKVLHPVNTWVGAVVGAVPPLMGWAAASGGALPLPAWVLAAGLYFWQMPHFMALAWMCKADYAAGGYRMLSNLDPTGRRVALCALRNCLYLLPLGYAAVELGLATEPVAYETAAVSGVMALAAAAFARAPSQESARKLFKASLLHLPLLMALMLAHRLPQSQTQSDKSESPSDLTLGLTSLWTSIESGLISVWEAVSGDTDERLALRMRRSGIECPTRLAANEKEEGGATGDATSSPQELHAEKASASKD